MIVDFDAQMQYYMIRVANFEPLYLKQFWVKIQSFCAHWTGNFLNFSKLTQLLSVAHFLRPLGAFKRKSPFFLGHPVYSKNFETSSSSCV